MNSQNEDPVQKKQIRNSLDCGVKRYGSSRFCSPGRRFVDFIGKTMLPSFVLLVSGKKAVTRIAKDRELLQAIGEECRAFVERSRSWKKKVDVMLDPIDGALN
jgi:hypothetical protein